MEHQSHDRVLRGEAAGAVVALVVAYPEHVSLDIPIGVNRLILYDILLINLKLTPYLQDPHPGDVNLLIRPVCPGGAGLVGGVQAGPGVRTGPAPHVGVRRGGEHRAVGRVALALSRARTGSRNS